MLQLTKLMLFAGLVTTLVCAAPIPAPSDWEGSRTSPAHIFSTSGWDDDFTISWVVANVGGATPWEYSYTLSGASGVLAKGLSHLIIQLSEVPGAVYVFPSGTDPDAPRTYSPGDPGGSNPGLPGDIYGVKWNCAGDCVNPTFTFQTTQAPMWGSFYAVDGKKPGEETYAYNNAFGTSPLDGETDFSGWIVTPDTDDGGPVIPEPTTMGLLGAGLGLLAFTRFYKR